MKNLLLSDSVAIFLIIQEFIELENTLIWPAENLQRARLKELYENKENNPHFTPQQTVFLILLAVASGIGSEIEDKYKEKVFVLMAHIGNAPGLKTWLETHVAIPSLFKGKALSEAAINGQLACVKYLTETCGQDISIEDKGNALQWAAAKGHLACVNFLIKIWGRDFSIQDKREALSSADCEWSYRRCAIFTAIFG